MWSHEALLVKILHDPFERAQRLGYTFIFLYLKARRLQIPHMCLMALMVV